MVFIFLLFHLAPYLVGLSMLLQVAFLANIYIALTLLPQPEKEIQIQSICLPHSYTQAAENYYKNNRTDYKYRFQLHKKTQLSLHVCDLQPKLA